ncbi:MAG TPA: ATP-binding protein [Candidatus Binatia bacterium]|nr:ATP-binding protein [Candidatus Binatia bacterium]
MDEHLLVDQAKQYILQGRDAEQRKPEDARKSFLTAAHLLVQASKETPVTEAKKRYVEVANSLYWRAHTVGETQQQVAGLPAHEPDEKVKGMLIAKPTTRFKDIGGLESVKDDIKLKIIEPFKHPEIFRKYGKKVGGGILMFGPPGCGKSLLAEATAGEAEVAFFNVKASDLKSKFVGETEANIAALFKAARGQPRGAIIFFDEFESLGGERGEDVHERNFVSQLLTEMDSVGNKNQKILLIAATNVPWAIDIALRREGRFGTTVFVPPPDMDARRSILELHLREKPLAEDVDIDALAKKTEGFSGADLKAICESATDIPLKEYLVTKRARDIAMDDFTTVLAKRTATTKPWFNLALKHLRTHPDEEVARALAPRPE